MKVTAEFDRIFGLDRASAEMGVHRRRDSERDVFVQAATPRLADDPTGTSVCTYGVLVDACIGSAAFRDPSNEQFYVGSRFSLNWVEPIARKGELTVVSHLVHRDERAGTVLSAAEIRQDGTLVGQALCRGVAIGTVESVLGNRDGAPTTHKDLSPENSRSLGLVFDDPTTPDGDRCGRWSPQPWMANGRGDVQGGVVLAVACEVVERVGARLAGPDRIVSLLDIDVNILRAPSTTTTHDLVCRVVRMGRRIGVLEVEVRDGDRCLIYASAQFLVQ